MTAPITISSLDNLHTHLPPSTPAEYVRYLLITTLQRKGFDSAEAGAIAEMEKLLEHHVQNLFESATQYAELANRITPTAADALAAQDEIMATKKLKRESKKRRQAIRLQTVPGTSSPPHRTTLDLLVDFATEPVPADSDSLGEMDRKPNMDDLNRMGQSSATQIRTGDVPAYAFDWAPGLPRSWMYDTPHINETPREPEIEVAPKVTSASMDFVKSTTVVGENIPPELGIVHFLKTGDRGKRRRMMMAGGGGGA